MKHLLSLSILTLTLAAQARAAAPATYLLTITNGSNMPLSPIVVYAQNGQLAKARAGQISTAGFVQLCQTGQTQTRVGELGMDTNVTFRTQTSGLVMPGESRVIEVAVRDPQQQSIQFETMYGKTKDICAVAGINGHSLYALQQRVTGAVSGKDSVVQTGAFADPVLPMGRTYLDPQSCERAMDAVTCLRSLAAPSRMSPRIRFFPGYLSSVSMLLETKYGAEQVLGLTIPTSGAVQLELTLKQ